MIQGSLLGLWMYKSSKQQSNLQLLSTKKLTRVDESMAKLAGNGEHAQQMKCVGHTDVFCFVMSPQWTKTITVIEITLLLQAFSCL